MNLPTLREAVAHVQRMNISALDYAALPLDDDIWDRPHLPGCVPSVVRLLARMRRDEPEVWEALNVDLGGRGESSVDTADDALIASLTAQGCYA